MSLIFFGKPRDPQKQVATPVAPDFCIVPYPELPLEQLYVSQNRSRWLNSRHTKDLRKLFGAVLFVGLTLFALVSAQAWLLVVPGDRASFAENLRGMIVNLDTLFLGTLLTSSTAALAAIFQFAKQRFSTADVFSSEIAARIRTLAADNSVDRIIANVDVIRSSKHGSQKADSETPFVTAYGASQESQFETFHRRSTDLGALGSSVVDHVTAFYSYHSAARDELRILSGIVGQASAGSDDVRVQVINIVFMVDLMMINGIQALDDLIETREHGLYCLQLALCVCTVANLYLIENMNRDDHRFSEVVVRNKRYAELIIELKKGLKQGRPWSGPMIPKSKTFL
jgi:hypothetical protein